MAFILIAGPAIGFENLLGSQFQANAEELERCLSEIDLAAADPVSSVEPCVLPVMATCFDAEIDDYEICVNALVESLERWSLDLPGPVSEPARRSAIHAIRLECDELERQEDLRAQCRLIGNIVHADELISIAAGEAR